MDLVADVHARVADLGGADTAEERALFASIFTAFADRCPAAVDRIEAATDAGDLSELELAAHALKGSAANVGAHAVAAVCADLEASARARHAPTSTDLDLLRAEVDTAVPTLRALADDFASAVVASAG